MQYLVLFILLFYLLIFLFGIFVFSKDNFVLLRKNVNTERMFNISFLVVLAGLLSARIFFVAFHFKPVYLNFLVFFLVPYFPGLSIAGGIIGASLFVILYPFRSKIPTLHVFDIFALSFLLTLPFGIIVSIFYTKMPAFLAIISAATGLTAGLLVWLFQRSRLSDGAIGYLALLTSTVVLYAVQLISKKWFVPDDILFLIIFGVCGYHIFKQEQLHKRIKFNFKPKKLELNFKIKKREKWREIR